MTNKSRLLGVVLAIVLSGPALGESLEPVSLDPITHSDARLTVTGPGGEVSYTPAELEALGAYRLVTTTPWRTEDAAFDGVLLREVLERVGLDDVDALRVVAENDFAVTVPRSAWESAPILIATRVNGAAHTRRERGPLQFVMPMSLYEGNSNMREGYWVWMAARIEAAE
jgi:hypothetical protein